MNIQKNAVGSALVYGLVIMLAVSIILSSLIGFIISQTKYGFQTASKESALQISESGVYFYRWYLAHMVEGKTANQIKDFWTSGNPYGVDSPYEAEYFDPGGSVIGKYSLVVTPPESGSSTVTVTSTGWTYKHPDVKRIIKVRLRRPSWSEYALLGNEMQRMGSGTDVSGKVFVNNGIHFDGVAHNTVSAAVSTYYDNDTGIKAWKPGVWTEWSGEYNTSMGSNVFLAGKVFPEPTFDFTGITADLSYIKSEVKTGVATNGCGSIGCYFDNDRQGRHIILKADGTFDIRTVKTYNNPGSGSCGSCTSEITSYQGGWSNYPIPDNSAIFVEGNVWLEGTIDTKRLTVVAANLISSSTVNAYIQKDITYAHADGSETLGIISQNDIEITKNSNNVLTIDAALLAQSGRVGRLNYGNTKSSITVYGAIATNKRYGFAYTNGTGYTTRNLYYDNNLLYSPPPYFPTGTQYLMDLWEEL
ncbi:MAG: hypothetical protein PHT88_04065 [Candidatus Moranbacteria bacterium]|nr:hypothetical protein [Candidatus Moranbacteria bacterium]